MAGQSPRGTYLDIARVLRDEIGRGDFGAGTALPSEAALVQRFGVARETVRRGLAALQSEGLVSKAQGKGWFVGPAQNALPSGLSDILVELRESMTENFNSGDRFYSENDLVKMHGISRHQARQILIALTADGLLITKPGTGRFVNIESKGDVSD